MKRVLISFVAIVAMMTAMGQNDQKARELLEQTSKKMQSYQTLSANFQFTMENKNMGINEKNTGSLLLKGKKYLVKLPDLGMEVYCDGQSVWNHMQSANQVMVSNAGDDSQGVIDPSAIFNVYQEGYQYKFVADKTENGKVISYIDLIPQDRNAEFSKITVGIDKAKLMVQSLVTHGNDGNQYGILVKDFKTDQSIDDKAFVFDKAKYPDAEVIDFR